MDTTTGQSAPGASLGQDTPAGLSHDVPRTIGEPTGSTGKESSKKSHAIGAGDGSKGDSKVPLGIQKVVPEKLERALPDSIHNTGDSKK